MASSMSNNRLNHIMVMHVFKTEIEKIKFASH